MLQAVFVNFTSEVSMFLSLKRSCIRNVDFNSIDMSLTYEEFGKYFRRDFRNK